MTYGKFKILPYNSCNKDELKSINSTDRYFNNEVVDYDLNDSVKDTVAINLCDDDLDIKISNLKDCNYYSVEEFQQLNFDNSLNIFHNNVNGLETKFDQLHNLIVNSSSDIDLIAITETSQNNDKFKTNIKIDNYDIFSTPTNTSKGGTAIFSNKIFNAVERLDLKIQHTHYESVKEK